jgi:hypothetical protein
VAALTGLARQWPATLQSFEPRAVYLAFDSPPSTRPAKPAAMRDLCDALVFSKWAPDGEEPPRLHIDCIRLLMDMGDLPKAREVARRLNAPLVAFQLKIDRRYDTLVQAEPAAFDIAALAEKQVAHWEAEVKRRPRMLRAWFRLLVAYMDARRYQKALEVADDVLMKVVPGEAARQAFDDPAEANWIYEARARANRGLRNWDAAERDLRVAAALQEDGRSNVSNLLNLAVYLTERGKGKAALEVLALLNSPVSAYGAMVENQARHAAALSIGDATTARTALAYLRKHRKDSPYILAAALDSAQQFDEAAQVFIELLENPVTRGAALMSAQDYGGVPRPPYEGATGGRGSGVLQRADVREVINRVGRIEEVPIP